MRYAKKIVKLPEGMVVGSEIGICGEGDEVFTITSIDRDAEGNVVDVNQSSGWREPLCKLYMLRGQTHCNASAKPENWIDVQIGECDVCGAKFADSCVYNSDPDKPESMICLKCWSTVSGKKQL